MYVCICIRKLTTSKEEALSRRKAVETFKKESREPLKARDIDKWRETVENPKVSEEEEEEDHAMDVSEEQNTSFFAYPSSESKSRYSSERNKKNPQCEVASDEWEWQSNEKTDQFDPDDDDTLLFQIQLTPSNRLVIPEKLANGIFSPLSSSAIDGPPKEEKLQLTDAQNQQWFMKITYYQEEHAFMITSGWQPFVNHHNLKVTDTVRFLTAVPRFHRNHYRVEYERELEVALFENFPEFRGENFLFEVELTPLDAEYGRLILPKEEVRTNFPGIEIPGGIAKQEIMKFTDARDKDWYMNLIFYKEIDAYMIISGWDGFVSEFNLEAMDVIKFFKPVNPLHKKHFLIDYKKRKGAETGPTEPNSRNKGMKRSHGGGYRRKEIPG